MKKVINPHTGLFALGVLQPATAREVRGLMMTLFSESRNLPTISDFSKFLEKQCALRRAIKVHEGTETFFSLTSHGNYYLPPKLRKNRDKFRFYLLRDSYKARFIESRGAVDEELAGASPAVDASTDVKGSAANKLGRTTFGRRFAYGQPYWPRTQGQFVSKTGPSRTPRDAFPDFLSFVSEEQLQQAGIEVFEFGYLGLALCLGVSPQLIWQIANATSLHYRTFSIPKKAGGERTIESPRVFLKVIQWFLADFVLDILPVHEAVHSFTIGRSIATNAVLHEGRRFVAGVDIADFFGSISRQAVIDLLLANSFSETEAEVISRLCTKENRVPQGAPTSPVIANAILHRFDQRLSDHCTMNQLIYSRYADDITVSGDNRESIADALSLCAEALTAENNAFHLNQDKTRIVSRLGQQRVTGAVVNVQASPPRKLRRKIRAAFDQAGRHPDQFTQRIAQLGGYIGYLKIFPKFSDAQVLQRYEQVLREIRNAAL